MAGTHQIKLAVMKKLIREQVKNIEAWILLDRHRHFQAKVQAYYHNGLVTVNIFDDQLLIHQKTSHSLNAALAGAQIGGITLYDDATRDERTEKWLNSYNAQCDLIGGSPKNLTERAREQGYYFTNRDEKTGRYTSCFRMGGLDMLSAIGWFVHRAI